VEDVMETINFNVPSISCSVCSHKIQDGLNQMQGIGNATVDLKTKNVSVEYNPADVKPLDIKKKVISMGYEVQD
jgi:copper chaperone